MTTSNPVTVLIEIPAGSTNNQEYDAATGRFQLCTLFTVAMDRCAMYSGLATATKVILHDSMTFGGDKSWFKPSSCAFRKGARSRYRRTFAAIWESRRVIW